MYASSGERKRIGPEAARGAVYQGDGGPVPENLVDPEPHGY